MILRRRAQSIRCQIVIFPPLIPGHCRRPVCLPLRLVRGAGDGPYDHSHSSALPSLSFANLRRRRPPISVVRSGRRCDGRGDAGPHERKHGRRGDVSSELQNEKRSSVASGKGTNDLFISPPPFRVPVRYRCCVRRCSQRVPRGLRRRV